MSRIRTIKPDFWTSDQVVECDPVARLLFIGMWNFCDDAGRIPASIKKLKMQIFPGDEISLDEMSAKVRQLIDEELLLEYEFENKGYLQVTGWHHQRIDRPNYRYPPMCDGKPVDPWSICRRTIADQSTPEGKGKEGTGGESISEESHDSPEGEPRIDEQETEEQPAKPESAEVDLKAARPEFLDLKNQLFSKNGCLGYLIANGAKERNARSLLGRWRRDHGDGAVIDAVAVAQKEAASEPVAFIERCLRAKLRHGNGQDTSGFRSSDDVDRGHMVRWHKSGFWVETWPGTNAAGDGPTDEMIAKYPSPEGAKA